MPSTRLRLIASLALATPFVLAACGGDDDGPPIDAPGVNDGPGPIDAPIDTGTGIDAPASTVVEVPCAGATIASEVTAPGFAFAVTDDTIAVGATVRFTMPSFHSAVSGPPGTPDGRFNVGFNETKCLHFTTAGSYPFYCNPHQFTATLTVQ